MTQDPSPTPSNRRPWYYQNWFLVASFIMGWPIFPPLVLWPAWAVLMIRSPWHRKLYLKSLAWAMLIVGGYMVIMRFQAGGEGDSAAATGPEAALFMVLPGVVLTVVTQMMWARHRLKFTAGSPPPSPLAAPVGSPPPSPLAAPGGGPSAASRRARARRRARRRRGAGTRSSRPSK